MEGWITLHRKFLSWEWFDKPEMVQLFIWLLLNANYADKKWQGIVVKRGQILTTTPKIMEALRLTERQTRTCISRLKSTGEVTVKTTNRFTIITICNYDRYQSENFTSDGQNDGQSVTQATDERRTSDGHNINNITNKQYNNINNNISVCNKRARTHEEREKVFKIFFFKNFVNPEAEVEKFYDNYEAQGWVRGNGQKIHDVAAVAKAWEQDGSRIGKRFPMPFVSALQEIHDTITSNSDEGKYLLTGIKGVAHANGKMVITCTRDCYNVLEQRGKHILFQRLGLAELGYNILRIN